MKKLGILYLSIVFFAITVLAYPLFANSIKQSFFYGIDPGIVYVTNAVLYTKANIISYMDHPGTPTIMLIHYSFVPLRLISKFLFQQNFIDWSFNNFTFLFLYERIIQLALVVCGLWFLVKNVIIFTNSTLLGILIFFLVFSFAGATFGISITPENFSFLLTSIWLSIFVKYLIKPNYYLNIAMVLLSGFAVANKFTSIFLLIYSVLSPLLDRKERLLDRIIRLEANIALSIQGFLIGIWPIIGSLTWIIEWGKSLFGHSDLHGTGEASAFNLSSYTSSINSLVQIYPLHYLVIISILILGFYLLFKRKIKLLDPVFVLCLISFIGILIFSKFPLIHYNYINILLIIFSGVYFVSKIKMFFAKALLFLSVIMFLYTSYGHMVNVTNQMGSSTEKSEYSVLSSWTPYWSSNVYEEQFDKLKELEIQKTP